MHTRPISFDLDQNSTLVRAFLSLRASDVEIVAHAVDGFGGSWSVQTCDDYDGYLFILVEPSAQRAGQLPSYMISGKTGQIELAAVDGDDCQTLGRFGDIYGITAELAFRLLGSARQSDTAA